jgi:hypothetical protein
MLMALEQERREFVRTCRDTSCASFDELLMQRHDLRKPGAFLLAAALAGTQLLALQERRMHSSWHSSLYRILLRQQGSWLRDQRLEAPPEIGVVTFNYDLNIEALSAVRYRADTIGCTGADAWSMAKRLPVAHAHGLLSLDDEIIGLLEDDKFEPRLSVDRLRAIGNTLALSTDKAESLDAQALAMARSWVGNATEVLFLGFGFDLRNLKRIGIGSKEHWPEQTRKIIATGLGLGPDRMSTAAAICGPIEFLPSTASLEMVVQTFLRGGSWDAMQPVRYPRT